MPFELNTTTFPVPVLPKDGRSSMEYLRRMFFVRWSAGRSLGVLARNFGVDRPALGFSDDDFFRACVQALAFDVKAIRGKFEELLEIVLGPYEDMYFEIDEAASSGDGFLSYKAYGDFIRYANWNTVAFAVGERLTAEHPALGTKVLATFKDLDIANSKLYFNDEFIEPGGVPFDLGMTVSGTGGGTLDVNSTPFRRQKEAMPLYGIAILDPGGPNEEEVTFVCPDPYSGRVRLVTDVANNHASGTKIKIAGGCWEIIETRARRTVVRVNCLEKSRGSFPGSSFVHPDAFIDVGLFEKVVAGDTQIRLDETVMEALTGTTFPAQGILNPDDEKLSLQSGQKLLTLSSYNATTRTFTVPALASGEKYLKNSKLRIFHAKTGSLVANALVGVSELTARCRWEKPYGVWVIDNGGANEEKVFVTGSTYQKRRVISNITIGDSVVYLNRTFDLTTTHASKLVISDSTGVLGVLDIDFIAGNEVYLSTPSTFSASVANDLVVAEYCRGADFGVTLFLSRATTVGHSSAETMDYFLGTSALRPTFADHRVQANWPGNVGSPDGRWAGPYLYEPSERAPFNAQGSGKVEIAIDRTELNDARIYPATTVVASKYDPATANNAPIGAQTYNGVLYYPKEVWVSDASFFPSSTVISTWNAGGVLNPGGEPLRLVVGGEGGFGRTAIYLWGRGASGSGKENILYVSGIARTHLAGVRVATYTTRLPVSSSVSGYWGGDPGLSLTGDRVLVDHGNLREEEVPFDSLEGRTPTRAYLVFNAGFVPEQSHDPNRLDPLDGATVRGTPIVKTDDFAVPRKDGFSFPFYLGGGLTLYRLKFLLNFARAAGIQVSFVDSGDKPLNL